MNSTLLFDKMVLACSEDKALLESNLSAVAGGRPMGRSFLGCGLTFFKYRDTHKAINSCHSNTRRSEKTSNIDINPQLNYLSHFWGSVQENGDEVALTFGERVNAGFRRWSLDGKYLYCVTNERDRRYFDGYKINAETYERELIFPGEVRNVLIDIILDGELATVVKNTGTHDSDLYLYDLRTGAMNNITPHVGEIIHYPVYFDRERLELYYTAQEGESWSLNRFGLGTGHAHCIEKRTANLVHIFYSADMKYRVSIVYERERRKAELYNCLTGERINIKQSSEGGSYFGWVFQKRRVDGLLY
jgi:hypothetical protein